jgi:hypothetical protein
MILQSRLPTPEHPPFHLSIHHVYHLRARGQIHSIHYRLPVLKVEADTTTFFAKHCPHLIQFTYRPDQEEILDCRNGYLGSLSQALQKLVRSCHKLETLKIEYVESLTCAGEQGNIDTSTSRVVKELSKGYMTRVSGWSFGILEHLQKGAKIYED